MAKPKNLTPKFPTIPKEIEVQVSIQQFSDFVGSQSSNTPIVVNQSHIESSNFETGSTGWRIQSDGDAEFNSGTFRGSLEVGSVHIPDQTTTDSFHVDSDGNTWWGATTLTNSIASITNDGLATFIGASTLDILSTTVFEDSNRFGINAVVGSGAISFGNQGVQIRTGTSATSSARLRWGGMADVHGEGVIFSLTFSVSVIANSSDALFGSGTPTVSGSSITFTDRHIGFKIVGANLYATIGTGSSEVVSSSLSSVYINDSFELIFKIKDGAVDFWWRRGNSPISSVVTLTTALPDTSNYTQFCVTNKGNASNSAYQIFAASLKR